MDHLLKMCCPFTVPFVCEMNMDDIDMKYMDSTLYIDIGLVVHSLTALILFITSCTLVHTANIGIQLLLTAITFIFVPIFIYYTLHIWKTPITVGITLGVGTGSTFIALMTAVFWAELSLCDKLPDDMVNSHYSCGNRVVYRFVSLLAVAIFVFMVRYCVL